METEQMLSSKQMPLTSQDDTNSLDVLRRMANIWQNRAQVKEEEPDIEMMYDDEYDDFLEELLPFHKHPRFEEIDDDLRTKMLSSGWIAYNEKTIDIESRIISPACTDIIYGHIPGAKDETSKWVAAETLVDEAYHILMVINTCRTTRERRDLIDLRLPSFNLVNRMNEEMAKYSEDWQRKLVQLSTCIVSEVFISDYLSLLSDADEVQPINRITTEAHRKDELAHSGIFRNLTKEIFHGLSEKERTFFCETLPKPVRWFASQELDVWETILQQLDYEHTREVIGDCRADADVNLMRIDYTELMTLSNEIGLLETSVGRDAFEREGLLN